MQLEEFDEDEIRKTFDVAGVGAGSSKKLSTIVLQKKRLLEGLNARLVESHEARESDSGDNGTDNDDLSDNWSDDMDLIAEDGTV